MMRFSVMPFFVAVGLVVLLSACISDPVRRLDLSKSHTDFVIGANNILQIEGKDTEYFDIRRRLVELGVSDNDFIEVHYHIDSDGEYLLKVHSSLDDLNYKIYKLHKFSD